VLIFIILCCAYFDQISRWSCALQTVASRSWLSFYTTDQFQCSHRSTTSKQQLLTSRACSVAYRICCLLYNNLRSVLFGRIYGTLVGNPFGKKVLRLF